MKLGLAHYAHLVDVKHIPALSGLRLENDWLVIGAATTHRMLERSPVVREHSVDLAAMEHGVANIRVRSVGTLGGNLCFADPHSDPASFLIAAGATLICQRGAATRRVPAAGFLTGPYQSALDPGELLLGVELPPRPASTGLAHL